MCCGYTWHILGQMYYNTENFNRTVIVKLYSSNLYYFQGLDYLKNQTKSKALNLFQNVNKQKTVHVLLGTTVQFRVVCINHHNSGGQNNGIYYNAFSAAHFKQQFQGNPIRFLPSLVSCI